MEIFHRKPQLSDILQLLCNKIQEILNEQSHSDYSYRLMPEDKIGSDKEVDIALEIALQFNSRWVLKATPETQLNIIIETLQAVIPPVFTYKEDPTNQTQLSKISAQYILDSLESVAGAILHFESGPGWCVLYYTCGMVLFMQHGLH